MHQSKILVVEDEVKIAGMIKKVIEADNFVVDMAHDGKQGLIMAENADYDLIVLDIMLPKLNGLEVCKALRYDKVMTPIIMLTARDTIEDRMAAADAGANDYLSKPFSFDDLLVKIKVLLESKIKIESKNIEISEIEKRHIKNEADLKVSKINKRIMDNIPVSIITIDKEGNMTSGNKYYNNLSKRKFTYNNNVFTGKFFIRENLVNDYKKLLTDGTMVKRDHCFERNFNGEDKYLKIVAVPLLDKEGNIDGAVSMALDDTESVFLQKRLQLLNEELEKKVMLRTKQLDETNKELAKVMDLKSIFVADVSHEMRTSLAIIQGNIELMSRGVIDEDDHEETYGQVFGEVKRMSTMLSDMALLSESETSRMRLDYSKIDVNKIIASICNSVKVIAREKNIKINHKNSKLPIEIAADTVQIEKLIINLLRNAIRYNKENGFVNIWIKDEETGIVVSVEDSGIGIPKEYLSDIFERFYRVDKARSRDEGGSGLGLAICKWVAEVHGGKIEVKSTVGEGSTFIVQIPRATESVE